MLKTWVFRAYQGILSSTPLNPSDPLPPSYYPSSEYLIVAPFGRSNEPRSEHTPHFDDFRVLLHTIFWVIGIPTSKMPNLFVDVRQDVVYAYGWPSRVFWAIWKVKRAPERAYASF